METLHLAITFVFGLCIGSFLNVVIYRVPASKSIMNPSRSVCPSCNAVIRFYDNIPLLSFLLLKGRCRDCGASISIRYPMVELLMGVFASGLFLKFGPAPETLVYFIFIAALTAITFIDIDYRIIPNVISVPGIPICFLLAVFFLPAMTPAASVLGLLAGGGTLLAVGTTYYLIKKTEGLGLRGCQAYGDDRRLDRLEGRAVHHLCRIRHRHGGGNGRHGDHPVEHEVEDPFRPFPFPGCRHVYFLWS